MIKTIQIEKFLRNYTRHFKGSSYAINNGGKIKSIDDIKVKLLLIKSLLTHMVLKI